MLTRRHLASILLALCPLAVAACQPSEEYTAERRQINEAARQPTTVANPANCTTGRLGDVTCQPTIDQVEQVMKLEVPDTATEFASRYESFQDWFLEAGFVVPPADVEVYLSNPDFAGLEIDGPAVQAKQLPDGTYRSIQLARISTGIAVSFSAFTT
jgi:hypothetical protein